MAGARSRRLHSRVSIAGTATRFSGSKHMLTRSPDKVYPSGTSESSGKKRTTVWGHKAPKQLTPLFSQPSPQHTLTERLFSLRIRSGDTLPLGPPCCLPPSTSQSLEPRPAPPQHSSQAPPSEREASRKLAKRAGAEVQSSQKCPQGAPVPRG